MEEAAIVTTDLYRTQFQLLYKYILIYNSLVEVAGNKQTSTRNSIERGSMEEGLRYPG